MNSVLPNGSRDLSIFFHKPVSRDKITHEGYRGPTERCCSTLVPICDLWFSKTPGFQKDNAMVTVRLL